MVEQNSRENCPHCNKEFSKSIKCFSSKLDDKRKTYYACPYCNKVVSNISLAGNEEVYTYKIED